MDDAGKDWLYESGKSAAEQFLATFEFGQYKQQMAARRASKQL